MIGDKGLPWLRSAPFLAGLVPYLLLVWKFDFLTDDAYISFRYSKNLAAGLGLRYNLGVDPPVEGFTNFLWVVWLAVVERIGLDIAVVAKLSSVGCGLFLLWRLSLYIQTRVTRDVFAASGAVIFFATLPSIAVWSTSGMATMPFALLVFLTFEYLLGDPDAPQAIPAGIFALLVSLIRADGPYWVALIVGLALLSAIATRSPKLARATAIVLTFVLVGVTLLAAFRYSYFGDYVPNTVRAKVRVSLTILERGFCYDMANLLTTLSIPLVLLAVPVLLAKVRTGPVFHSAILVAGTLAYGILVGGDFMTMGRFLVPALPFVAVLFAAALALMTDHGKTRRVAAGGILAGTLVLSLLPSFDIHPVPTSIRERFHFRWRTKEYSTEYERWKRQKENGIRWSAIGRALKLHTKPGESLVVGHIGAIGYYSDMFIYDSKGLVNREVALQVEPVKRASPGHEKSASLSFFRDEHPSYVAAFIFGEEHGPNAPQKRFNQRFRANPEAEALADEYEQVLIPLDPKDGFEEHQTLWLIRDKWLSD